MQTISLAKRWLASVAVAAMAATGLLVLASPPAFSADATICPSSASKVTTTDPWVDRTDSYNPAGFSPEVGTLAGCANSVSVVEPTKTDYYLYFSAADLAGKDLFGDDGILRLSVTGAPGAAGWYVQAFLSDGTMLRKTYGGGAAEPSPPAVPTSDGRFNYSTSRTLPDLSSSPQPALTGTFANPAPTYSVEYGYTLTTAQQQSVLAGNLAIYIGFLGATNNDGDNDILNSVKLIYYQGVTPYTEKKKPLGNPGIFLTVANRPGQPLEGTELVFGSDRINPVGSYRLTLGTRGPSNGALLSSGALPENGSFESRVPLSGLKAGTHLIRFTVSQPDGTLLRLGNSVEIGADGRIVSITDEALQPVTG